MSRSAAPADPPAFQLTHRPPWLIARFAAPQRVLSWALNRPGIQSTEAVAWLQVEDGDLPPEVDARTLLQARLAAAGLGDALGLLTSRGLRHRRRSSHSCEGTHADCVVTLGLSNAERVGHRRAAGRQSAAAGTINLLCHVSAPLSEAALLEALSVATQARTTAVLERGYAPDPALGPVTGTGTDCIVIACPRDGPGLPYAGLHTAAGEAIGAAVLHATDEAMELWLGEERSKGLP